MDSEAIQPDKPAPPRDRRVTDRPSAGALPAVAACPHCGQPVAVWLDQCPHCRGDIRDRPISLSGFRVSFAAFIGSTMLVLALFLGLCSGSVKLLLALLLFISPQVLLFLFIILKRDAKGRRRGAEQAVIIVTETVGWLVMLALAIGIAVVIVLVVT
jgi:hypothetical protein